VVISGPQTVTSGSSATFTVTATEITPLTYQWRKDGVEIPGATASSYTISSAQPWHIGDYSVVVTDVNGATIISGSALLQIANVSTGVWKGLVAYYPFDGSAQDRTLSENHGTSNGALLTPDRFRVANRAYKFNGINDYIEIADSATFK